jgi:hypothetical protein
MTVTRRSIVYVAAALVIVGVSLAAGMVLSGPVARTIASPMLPWVLGRGLGLAAFLTMSALTITGLWIRHPSRMSVHVPSPGVWIRVHPMLAAATIALTVGHLTALAMDRYAHVGWRGALVPGASLWRPDAVGLGTVALYGFLLVGVTAGLAGRIGARWWLPIHRLSGLVFVATVIHGITAGSDTAVLRVVYVITGTVATGLWASGMVLRRTRKARHGEGSPAW